MKKWLWLLGIVLLASLLIGVGGQGGAVSFFIAHWRLDVSWPVFLLGLLALLGLLTLMQGLFALPTRWRGWRATRNEDRALEWSLLACLQIWAGEPQAALKRINGAHELCQGAALRHRVFTPRLTQFLRLLRALALHQLGEAKQRDAAVEEELTALTPPPDRALAQALAQWQWRWALEAGKPEAALALWPHAHASDRPLLRALLQTGLRGSGHDSAQSIMAAALTLLHPLPGTQAEQWRLGWLLRSQASAEALRQAWLTLTRTQRRDEHLLLLYAERLGALGQAQEARRELLPLLKRYDQLGAARQRTLCWALAAALQGIESHWLSHLESALQRHPNDAALHYVFGLACEHLSLRRRARQHLLHAAQDAALPQYWRGAAYLALARHEQSIAQSSTEDERLQQAQQGALQYYEAATGLLMQGAQPAAATPAPYSASVLP